MMFSVPNTNLLCSIQLEQCIPQQDSCVQLHLTGSIPFILIIFVVLFVVPYLINMFSTCKQFPCSQALGKAAAIDYFNRQ